VRKVNHVTDKNPYRWAVNLLVIVIPLAYLTIYSIRFLPIFLAISIFLVIKNGVHYRSDTSFNYYFLMIVYCFLLSLIKLDFDVLISLVFFGWFVYWPMFIGQKNIVAIDSDKLFNNLVDSGIALSAGLFLQIFLYTKGIEIGNIGLFKERIAFSFIWQDYSFLSLFFTTLVPLTWRNKSSKVVKLMYTIIFLIASAATTARTGIFAIIIAYAALLLFKIIDVLMKLKVRRIEIYFVIAILIFSPIAIYFAYNFFPRFNSTNDSGRFGGYLSAFNFVENNIFVGAAFNIKEYSQAVDIIPHNLFVYMLFVGGFFFLILFLLWFVSLFLRIIKDIDLSLLLSILTSFFGFQFIPSFFSAYYFGFILSLCLVVVLQKQALRRTVKRQLL
jgi:hypothetical protein